MSFHVKRVTDWDELWQTTHHTTRSLGTYGGSTH